VEDNITEVSMFEEQEEEDIDIDTLEESLKEALQELYPDAKIFLRID
jgi:hypothetical protein